MELFLTILSSVLTIGAAIFAYYLYVKKNISEKAVELINNAEDLDVVGAEKKAIVVAELYRMVPAAFKGFITTDVLDGLVQMLFEQIQAFAKKQST